jgi:branched-chain amino acid aminotransferase
MPETTSGSSFDRKLFVNIQGELLPAESATVNAMDHGFLYGDSVYETIRTFNKIPFLLGRHLDRLQRSLGKIFMEMPCSRDELEMQIQKTIDEVPIETDLIMRIVITRGIGPIGLDIGTCSQPRYMIYAMELTPDSIPQEADPDRGGGGVHIVVSKVRRNSPRALDPCIKSGNFLNNILAFKEARDARAHDAVLCTSDGYLAECTTANIFLVKDGFIWTPRSWGILDGITRAVLFEEAELAGLPIGETDIPPEALFNADEVFITSSVKGVVPVCMVNGRGIGPGGDDSGVRGPITQNLQRLYQGRMEKESRLVCEEKSAGKKSPTAD